MRMTADSYTCTVLTPSVHMSTVEATCTALYIVFQFHHVTTVAGQLGIFVVLLHKLLVAVISWTSRSKSVHSVSA